MWRLVVVFVVAGGAARRARVGTGSDRAPGWSPSCRSGGIVPTAILADGITHLTAARRAFSLTFFVTQRDVVDRPRSGVVGLGPVRCDLLEVTGRGAFRFGLGG